MFRFDGFDLFIFLSFCPGLWIMEVVVQLPRTLVHLFQLVFTIELYLHDSLQYPCDLKLPNAIWVLLPQGQNRHVRHLNCM